MSCIKFSPAALARPVQPQPIGFPGLGLKYPDGFASDIEGDSATVSKVRVSSGMEGLEEMP